MSFRRLIARLAPARPVSRKSEPRAGTFRPRLEPFEDRVVPAVSILNNGGNGYSALSFNTSGGYVPPDTCGAAGPSAYVETVNQEVAIYGPKATGASAALDSLSHFL